MIRQNVFLTATCDPVGRKAKHLLIFSARVVLLIVFAVGESLSVNLVGLRYAHECGGIYALNKLHKIGVLAHCKGY